MDDNNRSALLGWESKQYAPTMILKIFEKKNDKSINKILYPVIIYKD